MRAAGGRQGRRRRRDRADGAGATEGSHPSAPAPCGTSANPQTVQPAREHRRPRPQGGHWKGNPRQPSVPPIWHCASTRHCAQCQGRRQLHSARHTARPHTREPTFAPARSATATAAHHADRHGTGRQARREGDIRAPARSRSAARCQEAAGLQGPAAAGNSASQAGRYGARPHPPDEGNTMARAPINSRAVWTGRAEVRQPQQAGNTYPHHSTRAHKRANRPTRRQYARPRNDPRRMRVGVHVRES